jgi:hypothetical protein
MSYFASSPTPQDGLYTCALRKVNELGYTVTNTNKDAGFITAEHQTSSGLGEALSGRKYHDVLTVSIFDEATGGTRRLRVTAAQTQQTAQLFGRASETGIAPSDKAKADANALLAACAPGSTITQQASAREYTTEARGAI